MREQDAYKVIPLVSDDGGVTWYPKGGDPAKATAQEFAANKHIRLKSDVPDVWIPNA